MNKQQRVFEDKPATRERVPLMLGLMGPSGGGKTYSALRLATGIQRVTGGEIFVVDTEARRALHYAERFKFRHVQFGAPFSPLDYLEAIEHCVKQGASTIIVDSMSHEHEGPGGVLEMHDAELDRMGGKASDSFRAWGKPKAERRRMINSILQMPCNFIFCFRAKEKTKPSEDKKLLELGFMPIAGEEFVYEMTANALLMPNANGTPTWQSQYVGEKQMIKLPEQFRSILIDQQLSEDIGEKLARWSSGGTAPAASPQQAAVSGPAFSKTWSNKQWAGRRLVEAPASVLSEYIAGMELVLADESKTKAHDAVRKQLEQAKEILEQTIAEEAMAAQ